MQRKKPHPILPKQSVDENTVVEQVGQTIVENSVALKAADGKDMKPESMNGEKFENETKKNNMKAEDKEAKEEDKKKLSKETSNPIVKKLVTIGIIAMVIGIIMAFAVNRYFGLLIIIAGAACVIACVYLPVGAKKK